MEMSTYALEQLMRYRQQELEEVLRLELPAGLLPRRSRPSMTKLATLLSSLKLSKPQPEPAVSCCSC